MRKRGWMIPSLGVSVVGIVVLLTHHGSGFSLVFGGAAVIMGVALTVVLWRNQNKDRP